MIIRKILPAALGLCISATGAGSLLGQDVEREPGQSGSPANPVVTNPVATNQVQSGAARTNQNVADDIAQSLAQSNVLGDQRVDIAYSGGVAHLVGQVQDQAQHDRVIAIVQAVPGVQQVRDQIMIFDLQGLRAAQAQDPGVNFSQPIQAPGAGFQEPTSLIPPMAGPGMNAHMQPPPMPPYAWPTYAPYNNFSRVAYPQTYPYEAFPFIGPMYPFPKVPPGWRAVTLQWRDGHWWYGRTATGHDWWRVRYW